MTSADLLNVHGKPSLDKALHAADVFTITGDAGHVNPLKANNPGSMWTDPSFSLHPSDVELNEPSFSVTLGPPQTFNRTVTNVGVARASYFVRVLALQGVDVSIKPENFHKSETEANIFGDIHP
ncbi:hypothetical protein RHGRI_020073 [Rhododendron griersonianum]|uniref:Subtilisin-like protease fibronectin type-III domain-containing protein n=1 Tax=Rhododendron griersonianum TaxID=479676 RepID=A0AAV6JH48_9ERIC|nr:hypothetical protein RHGRI_020073 [Rhododendron griersonianum]